MTSSFPESGPATIIHAEGPPAMNMVVGLLRASALLGPVSFPPHGWRRTLQPRRCPRRTLQQDTGTVPCGAETPRGRSQLQHPAGRGHRTPSPMRQTPLPNRPINECGTGACYGSKRKGKRERVWMGIVRFNGFCFSGFLALFSSRLGRRTRLPYRSL
jgi:hypothetical protein